MIIKTFLSLYPILLILGRGTIELNINNYAEAQHIHRPLLVLFYKDERTNVRFLEEF